MAFKTKNFVSVLAGMINQMRSVTQRLTDFSVGSVARTLVEGPAIEIEELYQNMLLGLVEGIPSSVYLAFGFTKAPALPATGRATFTLNDVATGNVLIAAGTRISTADNTRVYETISDVTVLSGTSSIDTGIRALSPGAAGNARTSEITKLITSLPGTVVNEAPLISGTDEESDDSRRARFQEFVGTISRAPLRSLEYGSRQAVILDGAGAVIERVVSAKAVELFQIDPANPLGYVDIYVFNGADGASTGLRAEVKRLVDGYIDTNGNPVIGYKGAGVIVNVLPVTPTPVDVTLLVRTRVGGLSSGTQTEMRYRAASIIDAVSQGGTLFLSAVSGAVVEVDGALDAVVTSPAADVVFGHTQKPVVGNITITVRP